MKPYIKCPYCECYTENYDNCEYCNKPLSLKAKKEAERSALNFDTSKYNHQHIKYDNNSKIPTFSYNKFEEKNVEKKKKNLSVALVIFIIWIIIIIAAFM